MLELKEVYHRRTGERFFVHERDFVREVIAKNKDQPVKGRNLDDRRARDVALNYKHALRLYKAYTQSSGGDNPSGMKFDDMADFVLRKMFVHCKGKTKYAGTKEEFGKTEEDMPPKWFVFTGYFTFLLFGPQPLSGKTLTMLTEDSKNIQKKGRKATREENKKTKDEERKTGDGGALPVPYKRGVAIQDKASAAHMANLTHQVQLKHCRDLMVVYNTEYSLLLKELSEVNSMTRQFAGDDNMEQETKEWRDDVKQQLEQLKE
jgi:hypothetical protein